MKTLWILMSIVLSASSLVAGEASVAAFTEKYEAIIKAKLEEIKLPKQRLETEYMMRQSYALHLAEEETRVVRSGAITTPEIEALRAKRKDLLKQLQELDKAIIEASKNAPVIQELQDVMTVNEERINAIRQALMKDSQPQAQPGNNP